VLVVGIGIVVWPIWQWRQRASQDAGTVFAPSSRLEFATCIAVAVLVTWALWAARSWPFQARLFPWTIGFPLLALALVQLGINARRLSVAAAGTKPPAAVSAPVEDAPLLLPLELTTSIHDLEARASAMEHAAEIEACPEQRGRPVTIVAWCFAFAFLIGLLGFKIGASLSTFLFLWLAARESWKITLGLAVGTYLFFVIAGDLLKLTELDPGLVADSLGVSTLDSFFLDPLFEALSLR